MFSNVVENTGFDELLDLTVEVVLLIIPTNHLSPTTPLLPAPPRRRRNKNITIEDHAPLIVCVLFRAIVYLMHRAKVHNQFFPRPPYCLL